MGNTASVDLVEGSRTLEVTDQLVNDFQNHITLVDRSLVSFARSIDSMRASCAILGKEKKQPDDTDEDSTPGSDINRLLETIDDVITDNKFVALETISKFLSFVMTLGQRYLTSESAIKLCMDQYRQQNGGGINTHTSYYDARIDSLQGKIKLLKLDCDRLQNNEDIFNEREQKYQNENEFLKKKNESIENELKQTKLDEEKATKENHETQMRNIELQKEDSIFKHQVEELINHLKAEISEKDKAYIQLQTKNREMTDITTKLEQDLKEKTSTLGEVRSKNASLTEDYSKATAMVNALNTKLQNYETEAQKLKGDFERDRNTHDDINKQLELERRKIQEEYDLSEVKVQSLEIEIKRLQTALAISEEKRAFQFNEMMSEKEKLMKDISDKGAEINDLQNGKEKLETERLKTTESFENDINILETSLKQMTKLKDKKDTKIQTLEINNRQLYEERGALYKTNQKLEVKLTDILMEMEKVKHDGQAQLDKLSLEKETFINKSEQNRISQLDDWLEEKKRLHEEMQEKLRESVDKAKKDNEAIHEEIKLLNDFKRQSQSLKTEAERLQTALASSEKERTSQFNDFTSEKVKLIKDNFDKDGKINELKLQIQSLKRVKENIETEHSKERQTYAKAIKDLETSENELKARNEESLLMEKIKRQSDEEIKLLNDFKRQAQSLITEAERLQTALASSEKERTSQFDDFTSEKGKLIKDNFDKDEKINELKLQIQSLKRDKENIETEHSEERQTYVKAIKDLETSENELKARNEESNKVIQEMEKIKRQSDDEKAVLTNDNENLKVKLDIAQTELENTKRDSQSKLDQLTNKNEILIETSEQKRIAELDCWVAEKKEMREKMDDELQETVRTFKSENENLTEKMKHIEVEKLNLKKEIESLNTSVSVLKSENVALKTKEAEMQTQLNTLEEERLSKFGEILQRGEKYLQEGVDKLSENKSMETKIENLRKETLKLQEQLTYESKINFSQKEENIKAFGKTMCDDANKIKTDLEKQYESEITHFSESLREKTNAILRLDETEKLKEEKISLIHKNMDLQTKIGQLENDLQKQKKYQEDRNLEFETLQQSQKEKTAQVELDLREIMETKFKKLDITAKRGFETNKNLIMALDNKTETNMCAIADKIDLVITTVNTEIEKVKIHFDEPTQDGQHEIKQFEPTVENKQLQIQNKIEEQHEEEVKELRMKIKELKLDIAERKTVIEGLKCDLEIAKQTFIDVQIICVPGVKLTKQQDILQNALQIRMAARRMQLRFLQCSHEYALLAKGMPIFIVCSRLSFRPSLEDFIKKTLNGKDVSKMMALIIFHERELDNVKKDIAEYGKNSSDHGVGGIFNLMCKKQDVPECDLNTNTIDNIVTFLQSLEIKSVTVESSV